MTHVRLVLAVAVVAIVMPELKFQPTYGPTTYGPTSVDAQGIASERIVDPVSVGGGQLDAFDPADGAIRRFTLHRVTSVSLVD